LVLHLNMRIVVFTFSVLLSFSSIAQPWVQLPDFPGTERDDGVSFVINNQAYCLSGLEVGWQCTRNGFVFDGFSETWSAMASLPAGKEREYAVGFSHNGKGYVFGGLAPPNICLNDLWEYDPATNAWTALANFPGAGRQGMSCFVIKDKAYILGGRVFDGTTLNEVWEYDFATTNWTQKNNLPVSGFWRGAAFAIDTLGYMCYGMNSNAGFNHALYRYDHINDSWSLIPDISLPARNYIGTAVGNRKACLYGGQDSLTNITNDLYVFDPSDSSLVNLAGIPTVGRKGGMAFSLNHSFYITTGLNVGQARVKETWKYVDAVPVKEVVNIHSSLSVFPNPAAGIIYLEAKEHKLSVETTIQVTDQLGKSVMVIPFNEQVDVSALENGIYCLKLTEKNSVIAVAKFVIAR
jgi:N-acetylneuraminic acid mutarotase